MAEQFDIDTDTIRILLAATAPPTDEEIRTLAATSFDPRKHLHYSYTTGATDVLRQFFGPVKP
jgi:hypothetical protein